MVVDNDGLQAAVAQPGGAMNKQPSKESLKDKVKGIFGIGPQRPPTKQTDNKPSEFIINHNILKVSDRVITVMDSCKPHHVGYRGLQQPVLFHRTCIRNVGSGIASRSSTKCAIWPNPRSLRRCVSRWLLSDGDVASVWW